MIIINIELKPRNKFETFLHETYDKLEDIVFDIILKVPERFIPSFLMKHIEHYIDKRTQALQQQIIKQRWQQVTLEQVVSDIRNKKKAPQED
ncbi:hypothetical protein ACTNA4_15915 [Bariatricus sp. HCP28S3_A7]|uniref:hypothetical protein n=1 Tax=Bariatricus sp. HCP28S3_A7 TaxID=3438894 RepID=UPI003F886603